MRCLKILCLFLIINSCSNRRSTKEQASEKINSNILAKSDTFSFPDCYSYSSIQSNIFFDTINLQRNKRYIGIQIISPKFSKTVYSELCKRLKDLINKKKDDFIETTKDEVVNYNLEMQDYEGWSMWLEPECLYQTNKVISLSVRSGEGYTRMPSSLEHNTINFDLIKRKKIFLHDYFLLNSPSDTVYFDKLLSRAMKSEFHIKTYIGLGGIINFSFDSSNVYFYFDKYDPFYWGIISINKKYILDHIHSEYRFN